MKIVQYTVASSGETWHCFMWAAMVQEGLGREEDISSDAKCCCVLNGESLKTVLLLMSG